MKNVDAEIEAVVQGRTKRRVPTAAIYRRGIGELLEWIENTGNSGSSSGTRDRLTLGIADVSRDAIGVVQHMVELDAELIVGIDRRAGLIVILQPILRRAGDHVRPHRL